MKNVVIIGAGASGLVAAIYAAKNGNNVTLIERNNKCGKKLLITGNGRCNYFNDDMSIKHFHSTSNVLNKIITKENIEEIKTLFKKIGIEPYIKNGYYYPSSNTSISFKNALEKEAIVNGVTILNNILVEDIIQDKKFIINPKKEKIIADKIILATGSKAFSNTGSDGSGYNFAKKFNHKIIKVLPALVKLKTDNKYLKDFEKIRCQATLTLYENNNFIKKETGEIQFTKDAISGICVFNFSQYVSKGLETNKDEKIIINFIPFVKCETTDDVLKYLEEKNETVTGRNIEQLLETILNYKIVKVLLKKATINPLKHYNELNKKEKYNLAKSLISFEVNITSTGSFEEAQVCCGGVDLNEINYLNMQSIKNDKIYIIGELLDVNGDCGGYNLTFAFISGMLAGRDIK